MSDPHTWAGVALMQPFSAQGAVWVCKLTTVTN